MRAASYRFSSYYARASLRRRVSSFLLAVGIVLLIVLALLRLGGFTAPGPGGGRMLSTFDVLPDNNDSEKASHRAAAAKAATKAVTPPAVRHDTPPPPVPPPLSQLKLPGVMLLSSADYRAADIGIIKGTASKGDSAQAGASAGDSQSVGAGPNGEPLYAAEWYREPTRAETRPYMPVGKTGWGIVACRTIDRYHVDDCRELGETPGSGISRGLRLAAWQFLVRPPRKGGQALIGAWVRIRFDLLGPGDKSGDDDASGP